jgi:hypothetical protein
MNRFEEGIKEGVKRSIAFFRYNLSGSSKYIEREHIERWLSKLEKREFKE